MLAAAFLLMFAASVAGETVYLQSLNHESYRRSQIIGHSETLNYRLRHSSGDIELKLRENKKINVNAPIFFNKRGEDGNSKAVRVKVPESKMAYFQDAENGAYVRSEDLCYPGDHGPCFQTFEGNLVINGKEYKLEPMTEGDNQRHATFGTAHNIEVLERQHSSEVQETVEGKRVMMTNDYVLKDDEEAIEDAEITAEQMVKFERLLNKLKQEKASRSKRQTGIVAHGIEMVLAIDHLIYSRFAARFQGQSVETILLRVREYFSHIINGVDLRYASIQENDISFYVTVAGFSISTREADSPWLDYSGGGATDGIAGLEFMRIWRRDTTGLPEHDHAAFMTGSNIQAGGSTGVVGIAYLNGVCGFFGVSINEELGFFTGAGVLAHELGHNLGSPHDSGSAGTECDENADFIMAPFVPFLGSSSTTINPWRFSPCSIRSFRSYVNSLGSGSCTLDRATIYDQEEFDRHNSSLAGQLYDENEQCELLLGDGATFCSGNIGTSGICRRFGCRRANSNSCFRFIAAHGTDCGNNLVCFEGLCQLEDSTNAPPTNEPRTSTVAPPTNPPTNPPTTAPATNPPTNPPTTGFPTTEVSTNPTTSRPDLVCEDAGTSGLTCNEIRFFMGTRFRTCRYFARECCELCTGRICQGDRPVRGRERYSCNDLIQIFGFNETCNTFAFECCFTCHLARKK